VLLESERVSLKVSDLCEICSDKQKNASSLNKSVDSNENRHTESEENTSSNENDDDSNEEKIDNLSKIKNLELELARVKLELVDAQCQNQEMDHTLKALKINNNNDSISQVMSSSTSSISQYSTPSNFVNGGSNSNLNNGNNNNNWLSKTFTQFKEATNQVVQKAQKVNSNNSS
jgi:hypothetical protein